MSHLINFIFIIVIQFIYFKDIHGSVINNNKARGILDNFLIHRSNDAKINLTLPEFNSTTTKRNGKTLLPFTLGLENLINTVKTMMMAESDSSAGKSSRFPASIIQMLQYHPSLHDPTFPLNVAISTYLLNETIQPINKLLQELKLSINNRDNNNTRKPQNYNDDDNSNDKDNNQDEKEEEDYLRVRLLKSKKNSNNNFDDSLLLKNFIRASVVEELNNNNKLRQNINVINEDEEDNKTTTTTTTTPSPTVVSSSLSPLPPSQFSGYYGGNGKNTSSVSLTSGSYGPPHGSYPIYPPYNNNNQMYYGPPSVQLPIYGAEQFRPDVYEPPTYESPLDSSNFAGVIDQWPTYYARGSKLSAPSQILRQNL